MSQWTRPMHNEKAASVSAGTAYPATPIELPKLTTLLRIRVTPEADSTVTLVEGADGDTVESDLTGTSGLTVEAGKIAAWDIPILGGANEDRSVRLKFSATTTVNIVIVGIGED